jgi:hypothetical protein
MANVMASRAIFIYVRQPFQLPELVFRITILFSMEHPTDGPTNKQIKLNPAGNLIIRKGVDTRAAERIYYYWTDIVAL